MFVVRPATPGGSWPTNTLQAAHAGNAGNGRWWQAAEACAAIAASKAAQTGGRIKMAAETALARAAAAGGVITLRPSGAVGSGQHLSLEGLGEEDDADLARAIEASLRGSRSGSERAPKRHAPDAAEADADLQRAITASLGEASRLGVASVVLPHAVAAAAVKQPNLPDTPGSLPVAVRALAVAEAAAKELPAEPATGTVGSCRVSLRLPDGTRTTRTFMRDAPAESVFNLALASSPVIAASAAEGHLFRLGIGGAAAPLERDCGKSIEDAGIADALLTVMIMRSASSSVCS